MAASRALLSRRLAVNLCSTRHLSFVTKRKFYNRHDLEKLLLSTSHGFLKFREIEKLPECGFLRFFFRFANSEIRNETFI